MSDALDEGMSPDRFEEFAAFDRLPVAVRRALQSTIRNWASKDAQLCLDQGYTPMALAGLIKSMDAQQALSEGGLKHNPSHMG